MCTHNICFRVEIRTAISQYLYYLPLTDRTGKLNHSNQVKSVILFLHHQFGRFGKEIQSLRYKMQMKLQKLSCTDLEALRKFLTVPSCVYKVECSKSCLYRSRSKTAYTDYLGQIQRLCFICTCLFCSQQLSGHVETSVKDKIHLQKRNVIFFGNYNS